jgi:hypothetical protein
MAAAQLRFLGIFCGELVPDTVEELDVALLRVLLHGGDEGPRHGACCLSSDVCIRPDKSYDVSRSLSRNDMEAKRNGSRQRKTRLVGVTKRDSSP